MTTLFKIRRDQLIRDAIAVGIDRLVVCDPVSLLYFTGIKITPYERFIALLLNPGSGRGQLILPSMEKEGVKDSGLDAAFYDDQEDPFLQVFKFLHGCRLPGVEKNFLSLSVAEKIQTGLNQTPNKSPGALADITGLISGIRLVKDDAELKSLSTAAQYSDEILAQISARIHVGQTEKDITMDIMQAMATKPNLSISECVIQVLAGKGSANPHGYAGDRALEQGDPVTIDFGVCFQHYWSDCTRTFFLGPPKPQLEEIYPIVLEAQQEAIATIAPGIPMAQIDLAARKVITRKGYGEYFIHRTGHGIGLSIHEPPSLHNQNQTILTEGMVVTIEPGIYLPGVGGVRIEDDVVVTANGAHVLTHYPKSYADMVLKPNES
jgi:Xaa-Pro dipeptidase